MSFQHHIDGHKSGKCGKVFDIGLPWEKCVNDDEVVQYVNYCFEVIGINQGEIDNLSMFNGSDQVKMVELVNEAIGAHNRIETCYKLLNGKLSKVMDNYVNKLKSKSVIYTSRKK